MKEKKTNENKVLVTGSAGFIGFHLVERLVKKGYEIAGLDNINDYYDVNLKLSRLAETGIERKKIKENIFVESSKYKNYRFIKADLTNKSELLKVFKKEKFDYVVNLAAQPGVRYSITNPDVYVQSNLVGFANILEACRRNKIKHLIYASTSSVYGLNKKMPLSTNDNVDNPISLYAATKKANELMAHTYSYLYKIPTTGLRFFTVYGPWGRPDMAIFKFTRAIFEGKEIEVYNYGKMKRDFTYIDDIVDGVEKIIKIQPKQKQTNVPYRIYNIGNSKSVDLGGFIKILEKWTGKKTKKRYLPIQPGDVLQTYADVRDLEKVTGFRPRTTLEEGVGKFVEWYKNYYNKNKF